MAPRQKTIVYLAFSERLSAKLCKAFRLPSVETTRLAFLRLASMTNAFVPQPNSSTLLPAALLIQVDFSRDTRRLLGPHIFLT